QTLFATRLPAVIGGSWAFMVPIISIIHDPSLVAIGDPHMRFLATMRSIQGALIVASSVQIILGYSQLWAICSRFFSPVGMVPVIALAGFGLFDRGFPVVGRCVEFGIPMLILFCLILSVGEGPIKNKKKHPEQTLSIAETEQPDLISAAPWRRELEIIKLNKL
ncbi:nucleobase-ascorbate transporter 2, partial [Tanacetum coccineum]